MLAAEWRKWRRCDCTQRDPRGDGCSDSSGGRLGWIKRVVVRKQNRQVEWILLEERGRTERKEVKNDFQFSCLYFAMYQIFFDKYIIPDALLDTEDA